MNFNDFCVPLYSKTRHKSQGALVITMLNQAGSTFWKASSKGDREYAAKAFRNGELSQPLKESFNNGFRTREVATWLRAELDIAQQEDRLGHLLLAYGFPVDTEIETATLAKALTAQLNEILFNPYNDAPVITAAYEHFTAKPNEPFTGIAQALIKGDRVLVSLPPALQKYRLPFYNEIEHTWTIQNTGKISWQGRELHCTDPERSPLRPKKRILSLGHLDKNKFAKLSTMIQARGEEGSFTSHWIMVDANGQNCFPNEKTTFNVVIEVTNPNLQQAGTEREA